MVITIDLDDNRRATNRKFGATATIKNKAQFALAMHMV